MPSPRRAFPYYKIQVYDFTSLTWIERKHGFDTLLQAQQHVAQIPTEANVRIVLVDEEGYHVVEG